MENLLLKKLQVKPNYTVRVINAPQDAVTIFGEVDPYIAIKYTEEVYFNVLIIFSTSIDQLNQQIESNICHIDAKTIFWVFYPKKSSKIKSDLDLMKSWEELKKFGLTPCASAAVNETWTALRLKFITEVKPSGMRNDHIKANEYGEYIDPVNKTIKLPEDLKAVLVDNANAYNYFNKLAYSHQKEYVLWILSAKQEKTRTNRIEKTIELLLNKQKK